MNTEAAMRRWWTGLSESRRAELRALDGKPLPPSVRITEDADGVPSWVEQVPAPSGLFCLPEYLRDDEEIDDA